MGVMVMPWEGSQFLTRLSANQVYQTGKLGFHFGKSGRPDIG